jgi:hypothetical protein
MAWVSFTFECSGLRTCVCACLTVVRAIPRSHNKAQHRPLVIKPAHQSCAHPPLPLPLRPVVPPTRRAFNDWPMYAERFFPEGAFEQAPWYRNFMENSGLVQFNHRNLAYVSLLTVAGVVAGARSNPLVWAALPPAARGLVLALVGTVCAQVRCVAGRGTASCRVTASCNCVACAWGHPHVWVMGRPPSPRLFSHVDRHWAGRLSSLPAFFADPAAPHPRCFRVATPLAA